MRRVVNVLIVDDYPMTIKGYKLSLLNGQSEYEFKIQGAINCDEVLLKLKGNGDESFDIILLDIRLPPSKNNIVLNGEDLGLLIRAKCPSLKIIVHTGLNDQQRINSIYKTLSPEGILIKPDIDPDVLLEAVDSVLRGEIYYSEKANKLLARKRYTNSYIDSLDRKILYYLSVGEKMKNLPEFVPLSMATIERRKKKLKILFGIEHGSDRKLLALASEKGFI